MIYRIFNNARGVIVSREAQTLSGDIPFRFEGAPEGATAIITNQDGTSYYRELENRECSIPSKYLNGCVSVSIALMNGKIPTSRWSCEGIKVIRQQGDVVLVMPDDGDIPGTMAMLQVELDELRKKNLALESRFADLKREFDNLKKGYNLT
jgi:hypothetical protein